MRRVDQPVSVQLQGSRPARIAWNDHTLSVEELIECWVHQTGWWNPEGGERRVYYRLKTDVAIVEVYRSGDDWTLSRISD